MKIEWINTLGKKIERVQTYDQNEAAKAIEEWGKSARMFQKSVSDGKGPLFTITRKGDRVVDITEDFDASF